MTVLPKARSSFVTSSGALAEDGRSSEAMQILSGGDGLEHARIAGQFRRGTELDEGEVGFDEDATGGGADAGAVGGIAGDVLQIRSRAGHPSGLGPDLVVVGMDAPGLGMDGGEIAIAVGADALGRLLVCEEQADDWMRVDELPQRPFLRVWHRGRRGSARAAMSCRGELRLTPGSCSAIWCGEAVLLSTCPIPQRRPCRDVQRHAGLLEPDERGNGGELEGRNLLEPVLVQPRLQAACNGTSTAASAAA